MHSKIKLRNSVAIRIVVLAFVCFAAVSFIADFINFSMYKRVHYNNSNDIIINSNIQTTLMIDGDEIEHYAKTLTVDENYIKMAEKLIAFKATINAKYLYIMADTGVPGEFTFIFDAEIKDSDDGKYYLGDSESKNEFKGGDEVLSTGKGFTEAQYYKDGKYGELYYAYSPVFNSENKVVAFVGTDIDISDMKAEIIEYRRNTAIILFATVALFALIHAVNTRRLLTYAFSVVTYNADRLSEGELKLDIPPDILARKDEIGLLANVFNSISESFLYMIKGANNILNAAKEGKLNERVNISDYKGDYKYVMEAVNNTINIFCQHFDNLPEAIGFFSMDHTMVWRNNTMSMFMNMHELNDDNGNLLALIISGKKSTELDHEVVGIFNAHQIKCVERVVTMDTEEYKRTYIVSLHMAQKNVEIAACVMLAVTDITILTQATKEAEKASRAKSDFLSQMSHEIRTPMNAIIGMTQIVKLEKDYDKIRKCIDQIEISSNYLLAMINDVLDMAKIESGKFELTEDIFSLSKNIEFVTSMFKTKTTDNDISFKAEINIKNDTIVSDSLRLNQAIINLLSNAFKFSDKNGNISLSVSEAESDKNYSIYSFIVSDDGIGISEDEIARLFMPFTQIDNSTTKKYSGSGLGLAITKEIVRMLGGSISVESKKGMGSRFIFTIKAGIVKKEQIDPAKNIFYESIPDFSSLSILVADDISINRTIIKSLLSPTGIKIEEASNGLAATEMFAASEQGYYDLIFMDMQMPEMDGCSATKIIRKMDRTDAESVIIVAMTANVLKEDIAIAIESGMDGHIGKPVDFSNIVTTVKRLLNI
ncbi:MAG: response regulator [Deferribacteraceae bacterium]|jgi:signal transduction histidine kinase/CheY-like chemotaxis protein/HAMP domain-containing protein|nr:response regulator [Deferribacteraceae bacterium]